MKTSLITQYAHYFPKYPKAVVKNFLLITQAFLTARSTNLNVVKDRIGIMELQQYTGGIFRQPIFPVQDTTGILVA